MPLQCTKCKLGEFVGSRFWHFNPILFFSFFSSSFVYVHYILEKLVCMGVTDPFVRRRGFWSSIIEAMYILHICKYCQLLLMKMRLPFNQLILSSLSTSIWKLELHVFFFLGCREIHGFKVWFWGYIMISSFFFFFFPWSGHFWVPMAIKCSSDKLSFKNDF